MNISLVEFEGSHGLPELADCLELLTGERPSILWHQQETLGKADVLVIPGGASFGDYLRPGALAKASPIASGIRKFALDGRPVLGIGNGFQVLCELNLLPGALVDNPDNLFRSDQVQVVAEKSDTFFTSSLLKDRLYRLPVACRYGRFVADRRALQEIEELGQVVLRYADENGYVDKESPFLGSANGIAGLTNRQRNVFGMMPHPERAISAILGNGEDGREFFRWFSATA